MSEFHGPDASRRLRDRLQEMDLGKLSEQEEHVLKEKMAALDKFFKDQVKAKYKLEIQFHQARSTWQPFVGVMYFLMNGNRFHGGGDDKIYLCGVRGCNGIVDPRLHSVVDLNEDPDQIKPAKVVCPKCNQMYLATELWGERLLKLTPQGWAESIHKNFMYLDGNADVSLIFHHADLHATTMSEMNRNAGGDLIKKPRGMREKAVYPLKNIIKDTAAGANLYDRFLAFIKES